MKPVARLIILDGAKLSMFQRLKLILFLYKQASFFANYGDSFSPVFDSVFAIPDSRGTPAKRPQG